MEHQLPLVSVVIPTFNGEDFIERALYSVVDQTHDNFEIIIIDDGSTDKTEAIVDGFVTTGSYRITYLKLPKNCGRSIARNAGLSLAKGDFIAFLDVDDVWLPPKTERQLELFNMDNRIGAIGVAALCRDLCDPHAEEFLIKPWARGSNTRVSMLQGNALGVTPGVMLKRSLLREHDKFDENLKTMEDYDFWLRLSRRVLFDYIEEPLVIVYRHKANSFYDHKLSLDGVINFGAKNKIWMKGLEKRIFKKAVVKGVYDFHAIRFAKSGNIFECIKCVGYASKVSILYAMLLCPYSIFKCIYYYLFGSSK